jgi:hypothetical protein
MVVARLIPAAELEGQRKAYVKKMTKRSGQRPRLVNVQALLEIGCSRELEWSGRRYHAPPLPFDLGVRLLSLQSAIAELRGARGSEEQLEANRRLATLLLHRALRPRHLLRRLFWPVSRPFKSDHIELLDGLITWLLHVPDAGARGAEPTGEPKPLDIATELAQFVHEMPTWCDRRGLPLSWAHFVLGNASIARMTRRRDLRLASASRISQADGKGFNRWHSETAAAGGW